MTTRHGGLEVRTAGRDLEIGNGSVCLRLIFRDGGYAQEYYATDSRGQYALLLSSIHKDLIPFSEHRICSSPMISGSRNHLFGLSRESLRMVYSDVEIDRRIEDQISVNLSGSVMGHTLKSTIVLRNGSNAIHITVNDTITCGKRGTILEYLMSSYAFMPNGRIVPSAEDLDYAWVPNLRPEDDAVIGDCTFASPAAILLKGRLMAALIPDLNLLSQNRPMPTALDVDINNGLLYTPLISYGFCDYDISEDGKYCRHDVTMTRRLSSPNLTYGYFLVLDASCQKKRVHRQISDVLWNEYGQTACERHRSGDNLNCSKPTIDVNIIKDAILSAPQKNGLFQTRFDAETGIWNGCEAPADSAYYSTSECSNLLNRLLDIYESGDTDFRILTRCKEYANFLISNRLRSGAILPWYSRDCMPLTTLRSSAETAASALFLAKLARITGLKKHLSACKRSAHFVINNIIPRSAFLDSTCLSTDKSALANADPHSCTRPTGTRAVLWTARMCLEMYKLTEDRMYLDRGREALDQISLLQCVWNTPQRQCGVVGLCIDSNIGGKPDCRLTAEYARCAMDYGALTGEKEYFQRGVLALSAVCSIPVEDERTRAEIEMDLRAIHSSFGSIYVHIARKWGTGLNGNNIKKLNFGRGSIEIEISGTVSSNGSERIVFGGLRGASYKLAINGVSKTYSRPELAEGIMLY